MDNETNSPTAAEQGPQKAAPTSISIPTPGMQMVQNAIEFVSEHVLQPDVKPMTNTSKLMADQAAAMMIQDMRGFLQGSEQFLLAAIAKAVAMTMSPNPEERQRGTDALEKLKSLLTETLPKFADAIGESAGKITKNFDGGGTSPSPITFRMDSPE